MQVWEVLLIILIILIGVLVALYFAGKRLQKKQAAQQEQIEATKQQVPLLIIDKKRLPLEDSGLPQAVIDQIPKLMRRNEMPVVKVKMGPRVMTMIADERIFDAIPAKKEVKATVSGIYITDVHPVHGKLDMKYCGNCSKQIGDDAIFCPYCGAKTNNAVTRRTCSECGAEIKGGQLFCSNCGTFQAQDSKKQR